VIVAAIAIISIVFLVFQDVGNADFLHWDDDGYILNNELIKNLGIVDIGKMFTTFYFANWHPLTWLSHAIDIQLFGYNPAAHHMVNLALHSINSVLVFYLTLLIVNLYVTNSEANNEFAKFYKWIIFISFLTSLWFAIHPLRIESFAWVSERKDILCAFFALSSTIFYLHRFKYPKRSRIFFLCSFAMFVMAIMSKGMAVTLPIVFLLLDLVPGLRFSYPFTSLKSVVSHAETRMVFLEKLPFLLVSTIAGLLVIFAQQDAGAVKSVESLGFGIRLLNGVNSIFVYISKTIFPLHLLPIYPYPNHVFSLNVISVIQILGLATFLGFVIYKSKKGNPGYLLLTLIYVVLLMPVLGILQVGEQPHADRYSYLPTIPLFIGLAVIFVKYAGEYPSSISKFRLGKLLSILIISVLIVISMFRSISYVKVWRDDFTIWSYVINNSAKPAVIAYNNLGARLKDEKDYEQAKVILEKGIENYPENGALYNNIRSLYEVTAQYSNAIHLIDNLIDANGPSAIYVADKSHYFILQNDCVKAKELLLDGINQYPDSTQLKYQVAYCYAKEKQYLTAIAYLNEILELNPNNQKAVNLRKEIVQLYR
jgi:hypothetical protein